MNNYLVGVYHYFRGYEYFTVEGINKADALEKAKEKARKRSGGNYKVEDSKVIKKLRKKD